MGERNNDNYIALIAEGAAEQAILDVLIDEGFLIYPKEQLLEESVIRTRNAKSFERKHLSYELESGKQVEIFRVLDSKNEKFKLSRAYMNKVASITNIRTSPEIEMLFIVHFKEYKRWEKSGQKPSEFIKQHHVKDIGGNIKAYQNVYDYWVSRPMELLAAIQECNRVSQVPREESLLALVKSELLD